MIQTVWVADKKTFHVVVLGAGFGGLFFANIFGIPPRA
jgi:hypothetical protein